jgi:uncharacterized protein YicC (UPF0701 family)
MTDTAETVVNKVEEVVTSAVTAVETTVVTPVVQAVETAATAVVETAKEVAKVTVTELSNLANTAVTEVQAAQKNLDEAKAKAASVLDKLETAASTEKARIQQELAAWMDATTAEINKVVTYVRKLPAEVVADTKQVEKAVISDIEDGFESVKTTAKKDVVLTAIICFAAGIVVTVGTFLIFF